MLRQENGKWFVYSEDGDRRLGGPFDSKDEAQSRLDEIERITQKARTPEYMEALWRKIKNVLTPEEFETLHRFARGSAGGTRRAMHRAEMQDQIAKADASDLWEWAVENLPVYIGLRKPGDDHPDLKLVESNADLLKAMNGVLSYDGDATLVMQTKDDHDNPAPTLPMVFKAFDEEKRITYGIVYEPDEVDAHGDFARAEDIEATMHDWMINSRQIGNQHKKMVDGAHIVDSTITLVDMEINGQRVKKGSWWLGVQWPKKEWAEIKSGAKTGYSLAGFSKKIPNAQV